MSFSASTATKAAENNLAGASNASLNQLFPAVTKAGGEQLAAGAPNVNAGTNFFKTLLNGNVANTTATLQPNIDQIRQGNQGTMQSINTLMPRGGGRSSALFNQSFAPQQQIQNLFNQGRTAAATTLPQIGLQQQNLGANLFGIGNSALATAGGINSNLGQLTQRDTQRSDAIVAAIGKSLFGLATTPFGGGSAQNGLLGLIG